MRNIRRSTLNLKHDGTFNYRDPKYSFQQSTRALTESGRLYRCIPIGDRYFEIYRRSVLCPTSDIAASPQTPLVASDWPWNKETARQPVDVTVEITFRLLYNVWITRLFVGEKSALCRTRCEFFDRHQWKTNQGQRPSQDRSLVFRSDRQLLSHTFCLRPPTGYNTIHGLIMSSW